MAFTTYVTVATGDPWSAANNNTYNRDNINQLWPYIAAGDLAYATSATTLGKLAKPPSGSFLHMGIGGNPLWYAGFILHAKNMVNFTPPSDIAGDNAWHDITGASRDLSLTLQCTIIVWAVVTGYNDTGGNACRIRAVVDGVADPVNINYNGGAATPRNEGLPYIYYISGIASGTRNVKLQYYGNPTTTITEGRLIVWAFTD